jgi:hypothetical protein
MTRPPWDPATSAALWDEYKYRHDLCWRLLFRTTVVVVTLSSVPYALPADKTKVLGGWLLFMPLLAAFTNFLALLWMQLELKHFEAVDREYIDYRLERSKQEDGSTPGKQDDWNEFGSFPFVINAYLIGLLLLGLLNLFVISDIWLPRQILICPWSPPVFHGWLLRGVAGSIGLALVLRGAVRARSDWRSHMKARWPTVGLFALGLLIWVVFSLILVCATRKIPAAAAGAVSWPWVTATILCVGGGAGVLLVLEGLLPWVRKQWPGTVEQEAASAGQ